MATDSILGLFTTPEQYQLAQQQAQMEQARAFAAQDPMQRAVASQYFTGGQLGRALGGEDPMLKMISLRNQLAQGKNFSTSEGWTNYAQELQKAGDYQGAVSAAQRATELQYKIDEKQAARETQLQIARERIQAQLDIAAQRGADAKELQQMRIEGQKELRQLAAGMGSGLTNIRQQLLEEKLATEKEKKAAAAEATTSRLENLIDSTANVMTTIDKAKGQVSGTTAGMGGRLLGWTTSATDLEETLNTVKANLGFDRLQQMRNESKTGGALGQVAVKELDRLEAARASLNRAQSPEQLKSNLDNVYQAYSRWREAATKALAEKQAGGTKPPATPPSPSKNPEAWVTKNMEANKGYSRAQVIAEGIKAGKLPADYK
jgi:tetratricopeptide (TPR) repeat protein